MFYFVAAGDNTGAVTLNIDSLGAKDVTRDGSVALAAGDIKSGEVVVVVYDGTRFQVVSQLNSSGDARFANVSIASALNVGGVATVTGGSVLNGGVVINEPGADADFRVEGDTDANLIFADASTDRVGIGTNTPGQKLEVAGNIFVNTSGNPYAEIKTSGAGNNPFLKLTADTNSWTFQGTFSNTNDDLLVLYNASTLLDLDKNGNLGLGVTPAAFSNAPALSFGTSGKGSLSYAGSAVSLADNVYYSGGAYLYTTTAVATLYQQTGGVHYWFNAPSGTAGNGITFTQAMTLDAAGSLALGRTSATSYGAGVTCFSMDGSAGANHDFYYNGTRTGLIGAGNGAFVLDTTTGVPMIFGTAGSERARITSGGDWQVKTGTYATIIAKGGDTDAEGFNGAQTSLYVGKVNGTGRSINAGGTVNASGTDYAEYMTKDGDFVIAKGDVCGIDANGKLTNVYANAVAFVVKSTDPSYVGGDSWGAGITDPVELEAAREKVDRIAFCGQTPVNVLGATPGQYIVPVNDNGAIKGEAVSNPTFEQYQAAVGKVIAIEDDGRARIIVKVA
jgi:hypothetical protein